MKKINFDIIFKIIVLLLLTIILFNQIISSTPIPTNTDNNSNQNGRYKEVKVKERYGFGGQKGEEYEKVYILDTQTGKYVE